MSNLITQSKRSVVDVSDRVMSNRMREWYHLYPNIHDKGLDWYRDAYEFTHRIAKKYEVTPYTVAVVLSRLSPNNKWERNKTDCENVIIAYLLGKHPDDVKVCTYNANKIKAFQAMEGIDIEESSPKTHAFAMNIAHMSPDHVTIDRWHLRACVTRPREGVVKCVDSCTNIQYKRVERVTSKLAKNLGIRDMNCKQSYGYQLRRVGTEYK